MGQTLKARVLVFGNPLVTVDSAPLQMLARLRLEFPQAEFVEFDAAEDLEREPRDLLILDAVEGIPDVAVITDLDKVVPPRAVSMHDFDLGMTLKLMKKVGILDSVTVVGVPTTMGADEAYPKVAAAFRAILPSGSGKRS